MTTLAFGIYFMKPDHFRNGIVGYEMCKSVGKLPDVSNLDKTHEHVKDVEITINYPEPAPRDVNVAEFLIRVFMEMQAESWSPNGEARALIRELGLMHTSMCVGDIAVDHSTGHAFLVDNVGWKDLGCVLSALPEVDSPRIADRIDGFDRDDLGESPDY